MNTLYEQTTLTPLRVARASGFLDWSSQPSLCKHYPDFLFRYVFGDVESLRPIELARMISSTTAIASKPYHQLTVPSAGNLHPIELYVQIRGIKGVLSGIYHVDTLKSEIVLIQEVEADGLEPYVGLEGALSGMLFVVSSVPFRAEWKYGERAIRYCYLDLGHQLGALSTSMRVYQQNLTILSEFDKKGLNEQMGFGADESVAAVVYYGELIKRSVTPMKQKLMRVAPTDYSELSDTLRDEIIKSRLFKSSLEEMPNNVSEQNILQRRSARYFDAEGRLTSQEIESFMTQETPYPLSCYVILLNTKEKAGGVYLKNKLLKEGEFAAKAAALLVDQKFVQNADLVFVLTSKNFSENTLAQAGIYVHKLYMQAELKGLGCSGIGAFYDKKMQDFLGTDEKILYVSVIGVNKK
jgi:SagB-type dehydrogenase family enzyme